MHAATAYVQPPTAQDQQLGVAHPAHIKLRLLVELKLQQTRQCWQRLEQLAEVLSDALRWVLAIVGIVGALMAAVWYHLGFSVRTPLQLVALCCCYCSVVMISDACVHACSRC
jgi:hypothetical protein